MRRTIASISQIKQGLKSVVRGLYGVAGALDEFAEDFQFWAAGHDWQIDFGPVYGEAGTVTTLSQTMQCKFRGEKIMATDWAKGLNARIQTILVGQKLQRPLGTGGTLVCFLSPNALGNGMEWDVCRPGLDISITVSFVENCTLDLTVFGRAIT